MIGPENSQRVNKRPLLGKAYFQTMFVLANKMSSKVANE
jgi:hypothetical protein